MHATKIVVTIRAAACLSAVASWFFLIWLLGIPLFLTGSKNYFFGGIVIGFVLCIFALAVALVVKCPNCGRRMLVDSRPPSLYPDWQRLRDQFFPLQVLMEPARTSCVHCQASVGQQPPSTTVGG